LYFTFPLSYRDVQKLLLYRGIDVSHKAIRAWCQKFGQQYANEISRRRPRVGDKWHLDKMVVTINSENNTTYGER
jgi:putative transposase